MRRFRTFGVLSALVVPLALTTLGVVPGATGGAWARVAGTRSTPPVGARLAVLRGSGANRYFGSSVAISGTTAVVGDDLNTVGTDTSLGRVYVFAKTAAGWKQSAELKPPAGASTEDFGYSLAISGTIIVVGAPDAADFDGRAYVFAKTAAGWKQTAALQESDPTPLGTDAFGTSVGISGATIAVGAPDHPHGTGAGEGFGETFVFAGTAAGWKQTAELKGPGGASSDGFGTSVGVSGATVAVGAPYAAVFAGRTYVFARTAAGWKQTAVLKGSDTTSPGDESGDMFGRSVAISGGTIAVGAPQHRPGFSGRVYVFTRTPAGWKQTAELKFGLDSEFGGRVAVSGKALVAETLLINEPALVFAQTKTGWKQAAGLKPGPGDPGPAVAISGAYAVLGGIPYSVPAGVAGRAFVFGA